MFVTHDDVVPPSEDGQFEPVIKDATRYVHLKLPTVIFGATGFGTHAKHERVSLRSLVEYTEMFTKYLTNLKYR